jgi:hypothetical protein
MNAEVEVLSAQQRLIELGNLGHDLVETLEQIVRGFGASDLDVEIEKAKTLINLAKDKLPPDERQGYTTSREALERVIDHLSHQTCPDTRGKARRIAVDPSRRTVTFGYADYEINLDMIRTETDLLEWIQHLCEKTWMDTDLIREFIETVGIYWAMRWRLKN